ncbi:MAG: integrase, partial [Rhodobacterales bacterium]|nr:integrase [Rhodobacterales bacterium]
YAFPGYNRSEQTNGNSASAALNKWLKSYVPEGCSIHSFRHSMRDRLRSIGCPSDMIDQIGGWSKETVGQGYGLGFDLETLVGYIQQIAI